MRSELVKYRGLWLDVTYDFEPYDESCNGGGHVEVISVELDGVNVTPLVEENLTDIEELMWKALED